MGLGFACFLLSVASWTAPQPKLSAGLIVDYGDRSYIEGNAEYRGYDLAPYFHRCGIASISPAHLGRIAWVWVDGAKPYGPCLVVDVMARHHACEGIRRGEVAEVPTYIMEWFGAKNGMQGYVFFGVCAPAEDYMLPRRYRPPITFDDGSVAQPIFWPYPKAQPPQPCPAPLWR